MVSNQQYSHQVRIDEFLRALRSLGAKKDDIINEPLKIKYFKVMPLCSYKRHSTFAKYELDKAKEMENNDEENMEVRPPSPKRRVHKSQANVIFARKKWLVPWTALTKI